MGNCAESQELICLGSRIRERRLSAGLSQEVLAEKAGISPNTVSRIEGGLTEMYVETFRKLVHALGADAGDLLCKKEQSDSEDNHIKSILRRMNHMEKWEQEIVAKTVSALADALEKKEIIWKKTEKKLDECNEQLNKLQDILVSLEEDYSKHNAELQNEKKEYEEAFYHVKKRIENVLAVEVSLDENISAEHLNSIAEKSMRVFLQDKKHISECMESLSRLKYNREVKNYFNEFKELERKLKKVEDEYVDGKESLEKAEKEYTLQKQIIEKEMDEFLKTYSMGEIYEMLE